MVSNRSNKGRAAGRCQGAVAPGWGNSDYPGVTDWQAWMDEQDAETTVVLHIETALGYKNAEEIISVPGVDMVYAGPGDSSIELGHPGDYNHPDVRALRYFLAVLSIVHISGL